MWLNDLLPQSPETRPTRPTSKNNVGRPQSLMAVAPSDTSDTSDTKKAKNILFEEFHQKEEGIAQVSYENPESVRHAPEGDPTPAQLDHARRMLVDCPSPSDLPPWIRPYRFGETLDDTKERRCASYRCGAVFMRGENESNESWSNKRYCSGACFSGKPSVKLEAVEVLQ